MKLRTAAIAFATVLVAAAYTFVQPRIAAQGGVSQAPADSDLDGTLEVVYEDGYTAPRLRHFIKVGTDRVELNFSGRPPHMATGTHIRARGRFRNGKLDLSPLQVEALGGSGAPNVGQSLVSPFTFGPQSTLVILFNFNDLNQQPYTTASAQNVTFTQVNNFDLENSFNQTSLTGTVTGWYTINMSATTGGCNYPGWATAAEQAATNAGVDLTQYPRRVFGFPQTSACAWWGLGTIGGGSSANPSRAWINGTFNLRVVAHEMGHNFGLYHSRSNTCDSSGCVVDEYGDDHDSMGGGAASITGHFNAYQKERIGWLDYGSSPSVLAVNNAGQYALEPYATPWGGLPKALRVVRSSSGGSTTYVYAEARTQYGIDGSLPPGVIIHTGTDTDGSLIYEEDVQPASTNTDFILDVGQSVTFSDASGGVTLRTLSFDNSGATIEVTPTCPLSLGSTGQTFGPTGGTGSVSMTTNTDCPWTATSDSAWLTVNTGSTSGTGSATIQYTVATNPDSTPRTGHLTIGTQTYNVVEAGNSCSFTASPTSQFFNYLGGNGSVTVTTTGGCNWNATGNAAWITINTGSSGTGNGTVTYSIASQLAAHSARTGTMTVAGQTVTITQEGVAAQFVTPTDGATGVSAPSTTFQWTNVSASRYILLVGTTPGGSDLVNTGELTSSTTSFTTASVLPSSTLLYARVRTKWNSVTFTAADISFTTTDHLTGIQVLGSPSPSPVIAGGSTQYGAAAGSSVKVTFSGNGGGCSVTLSATGLPSGASAAFNPSTLASSAASQYSLMSVSTTGSTPPGTVNFTVRAQESVGCGSGVSTTTAPLSVISPSTLSANTAGGTYGGSVGLSATLTSGGSPVSGKSVAFTLNGASVGSATTNGSGVATIASASLSGIAAGTYSSGVSASFAGDATYASSNATSSLTVGQKSVTPSIIAAAKPYDGNASATLTSCTLSGLVGGDVVSCTGTATFANAAVGTGKTVTATGLSLTGAQAANYTLSTTTATTTANITAVSVTPSVTAANKVYDRAVSVTLSSCTLTGVIGGDAVTCSGTATFASASVGTGKTVTASGIGLGGAQAGNYTLSTTTATTTANITAVNVTPSVTAANKPYDATTSATLNGCSLSGVISPDVVTCSGTASFATAAVGSGKTVNATGLSLSGAQAGNYALSSTSATTTANITAASVSPSITAANKPYDRTIAATINSCTLSGMLGGDVVTCAGSATFDTASVGTGKTVTASGITLSGAQAGNYTLSTTTATGTANITAISVTASVTANSKTYDATTNATLASCTPTGVLGGDVVTCSGAASFATAAVGAGKTVTATGLTLTGPQAANYALSSTAATTTASITAISVTPSVTAANKIYDRTVNATLSSCTLTGVINGDVVTCSGTAAFASATVGTGKTVNVSSLVLGGAQADNYTLSTTTATTTANITAVSVTPSVTAANKTYDATTTATLTGCTPTGVLSGDTVTCSGTASFANATVGSGKTVTAIGITLGGAKAANYTLSSTTATTTATITAATVSPNITVGSKPYDGTMAATITGCGLNGVLGGDVVGCTGTATFDWAGATGSGTPASATPTLIQHVSTASNNDVSQPGNPYFLPLPNPTGAGNALILGMSYPFAAGNTPTVTDDKGNVWVAGITTPSTPSSGQFVSRIYYALGVATGTQKITVTFTTPVHSFQAVFSEFYNVATVTALDGSTGNAVSTAPNVSAGTLTTASGGDLIYSYGFDATPTSNITRFTAGPGFTLLSADTSLGTVAEYAVQGSAGSVTPTVSVTGSTDRFNAVAIALKGQSAGTAPGSGIRIVHVYHVLYERLGSALQFPSTGNLLVVTTSFSPNQSTLGVSSNPANTWVKPLPAANVADLPQFWYAANAITSPDLQITPTVTFPVTTILMYDVAGAATSPFDATAGVPYAWQSNTNNANLIGIPVFTPSSPNELVFGTMANGIGPTTGMVGPGFILNTVLYGGEIDRDSMDNADGYAHYYSPGTAPASFSWKMNSSALPETSLGMAIGFRSASPGNIVTVTGLTLTGPKAGNYSLSSTTATTTALISTATLTATVTAANKTYDHTPNATLTGCTLTGVVSGDIVNCTGGTASFADATVGTGKTVTVTGLGLSGAQSGNYTLSSTTATTTASITGATVTPSVTAASKAYDSTPNATLDGCTLTGVVSGDIVNCTGGTASFADATVGTGKTVTVTGLGLSGAQAGNYTLSTTTATTPADITAISVTPSVTASNKPYDRTTAATIANCSLNGVVGSDDVTCSGTAVFESASVGNGKTVTATGLTLDGAAATNYTLSTTTATTTANITPISVTPSIAAADKPYDRTVAATISGCTLTGVLSSDVVTCSGSASFASATVGTGKTVTAAGLGLAGADSGNYTLSTTTATTTASITAVTVTPSITTASKAYDATNAATISDCALTGVLSGDLVTCSGTASFDSATVGTGKTVTVSSLALSGAAAGNYTLSSTTATTTGDITAFSVTPSITAANKPYDSTAAATIATCTPAGIMNGDSVSCTGTAHFDSAAVGNHKTVTSTDLTLSGPSAGNYALSTASATTTASITALALTPAVTASNRPYDGTTTATLASCTLTGVVGTDIVQCTGSASFDTAAVGANKSVTVSGLSLSGAAAGNYTLSTVSATTTAAITAASLAPAITAASKSYDGTDAATITCALTGVLNGDQVTCSGTATFDSPAVGLGKTVAAHSLALGGASASNYALSATTATALAAITPLSVVPVISAADKPYDGTAAAALTSCDVSGALAGDVLTCSGTATFDSAAAGAGKTVTASNLALVGPGAGNYALSTTTATTSAAITTKSLTASITAASKVYDGTTTATLTGCSLSGVIGADAVACDGSATFNSASVGTDKIVTSHDLTLTGDVANYSLPSATTVTTAAITPLSVIAAIEAASKDYDRTPVATITDCTVSGAIAGDAVWCTGTAAFNSSNAGKSLPVWATSLALAGPGAGNYILAPITPSTTADIRQLALTATVTVVGKPYDGITAVPVSSCTLAGVIDDDDIQCNATAFFDSPEVGLAKPVTVTTIELVGSAAENYTAAVPTSNLFGSVATAVVTPAISAADKTYDGTDRALIVGCTPTGVAASDVVYCASTGRYAGREVGAGKTVSIDSAVLVGPAAGNYTLAAPTNMVTASIFPTFGIASITALNRPYDGTTTATLGGCTLTIPKSLAIEWDANIGAEGVLGYLVRVGTTPGDGLLYDVGNVTSFTYPNVQLGQDYFVAVAAYNESGIGSFAEVSGVTQPRTTFDGDDVSCTGPASFDSPSVGASKMVTATALTLTGGDSGNYALTTPTATTIAAITGGVVSATVTVAAQVYDGTSNASIANCALTGIASGDVVACIGTATFDTPDVGLNKTVTISGLTLTGPDAGSYSLASTTTTATGTITAKHVTPTVSVAMKVYDGNTSATLVSCTLPAAIPGDPVSCTGTATFSDSHAGSDTVVTVTNFSLHGPAAGNYRLVDPNVDIQPLISITTFGTIEPKTVEALVTATNKTYDGTMTAAIASCEVTGTLGADVVGCNGAALFDSASAGVGKPVAISSLTLTGAAAANYSLTATTAIATADIAPLALTANGIVASKTYDGTTSAVLSNCAVQGALEGDTVACAGTVTFDTPSAGSNKSVTISGLSLSGAAAANYTLSSTTALATGSINPRSVTPVITAANKRYDGTTTATVTSCTLSSVIGGDPVTCSATAAFASAAAGTNKPVTTTQVTLGGAAAANYALSTGAPTTTASIIANVLPAITNPGSQLGYQGVALTLPLTATDADGDSLTWSSSSLVPGTTLNPSTGVISGMPTAQGGFTVAVSVSDGWDTAQVSFSWTVGSPVPAAASLSSPIGSITTTTPTFTWPAVPMVEYYLLWITDSSSDSPLQIWYTPTQAGCAAGGNCVAPSPRALKAGLVTWKVITWNHFGYGPWSSLASAVVDLTDSSVPTPTTSGPSGAIGTRTPTYSWGTVANATWYQLSTTDALGVVREYWYTASQVCTTSCAANPTSPVAVGLAKWHVRAWRVTGAGAWSGYTNFDAADGVPGTPTLLTPTGSVTSSTASFTWNALSAASYYLLRFTDRDNVATERWYRPADVGCLLGTGTCTANPGIVLKAGAATWKVLAWNGSGYGQWSEERSILIEIPDPSAPAPLPVSPTGSITSSSTQYRWTAVPAAINYRVSIRNNGGAPTYFWYWPAAAGCDAASECSIVPLISRTNGTEQWQVQAWTTTGYGPWSTLVSLAVNITAPLAPVAVSPSGLTTATTVFKWNAAANTTYYYVRVFDSTGQRVDKWPTPAQVGCSTGGVCTFTTGVTLASGAGSWQVLAWNPSGYSQWSSTMAFTVP